MALRTVLTLPALSLVALSACTDPAMIGQGGQNTTGGTIVGGITGAILGANLSSGEDRTKGAIIGGLAGAAAGNVLGQRLDQQAADLQRDLGNNQVKIENTGSNLLVTLPQDILFAVNSTEIRSDLRRDLQALAGNLAAYPDTTVQIIGHTDNTGPADYNLDLSQRRARVVGNVLVAAGVAPSRVQTYGRGEDQPVASNLDPQGQAQNRRVEVILTPNI